MPVRSWAVGDHLTHRHNLELGVGRVTRIEGRTLVVEFPRAGTTLRLSAGTDALLPVTFHPGHPVRVTATREDTTVVEHTDEGQLRLANGALVSPTTVWPLELDGSLGERLALGELDHVEDFGIRLRALRLLARRQADGLGSFLGGRVRLFPHQLHVAELATRTHPVRWLLADEVGLGKTIEAALILNHLVHTARIERCLVVAPESLTVQWLGELWRKYHQVFTLLDERRLADVDRDFGRGFNPFDVHRRAVVSLELLTARPELTDQAVGAGIDVLVVDEAQRLRRPPGHPGEPAWRAVAPIAALGRHVLLLSATPFEADTHGFFRLLQLLRPDEFPEDVTLAQRLASGAPLPPCASSTRRSDIGGLPPRIAIPISIDAASWHRHQTTEAALRHSDATNPVIRRQKMERVRRAMASGAALRTLLGPEEHELRERSDAMDRHDPRIDWLIAQTRRWKDAGQKTLVFVAHRETLEMLRTALSHRGQLATGAFHEDLSTARRDLEVARFRETAGPSLLVTTECGGEGRNFEFCHRLVLFDLPWNPATVEQRIGRLDRIGRTRPVEVVYFVPPAGIGRDVVRLFEALDVFVQPLAGLEPQLAHLERAIEDLADHSEASLNAQGLEALVASTQAARDPLHDVARQQLHRQAYRAELGPGILARVPPDLDELHQEVVLGACERMGFTIERQHGQRTYSMELGNSALVESLPGVPGGASFTGSFDRLEAVERETIDFFASGHPLVEGVLAHLDDSPAGRAVHIAIVGDIEDEGIAAVYKTMTGFEIVALDVVGRQRPEWAAALSAGAFRASPEPAGRARQQHWASLVRRLVSLLGQSRRPYALAALVIASG